MLLRVLSLTCILKYGLGVLSLTPQRILAYVLRVLPFSLDNKINPVTTKAHTQERRDTLH